MPDFDEARERMVEEQIEARGIRDRRLLDVMRRVPRHLFIPPEWRHQSVTIMTSLDLMTT